MASVPRDPAAELEQARLAYDTGRLDIALALLRGLPEWPEGRSEAAQAARLQCLAAYRLGELGEAASLVRPVIEAVGPSTADPMRFDVLAVGVVACGELAQFDDSLDNLRRLLSLAARSGSLADHVRGRGSAAACFALLGDPWAGRRLLAELIGLFQGLTDQLRLEATARNNHTAVCLQLARVALQGHDAASAAEAIEHAQASLQRTREIAEQLQDGRVKAFADVHEGEMAMLERRPQRALELVGGAAQQAEQAGLWAHVRQLNTLLAEAHLALGDAAAARAHLDRARERLGPGHELSIRIRVHAALQRAASLEGEHARAVEHLEQARELAQFRQYRQMQAQSRHLRARLEIEHLYPFRGTRS